MQFAYAIWQFIRVAKFFRVPGALVYHLWIWIAKPEFKGCKPFSRQTIVQVVQGTKWIYNARVEDCLRDDDKKLNEGHYLQRRRNVDYVVLQKDVAYCNILDRHSQVADTNNTRMFLCAKADLILPNVYIADAYEWLEGFEKFLQEGASGLNLRANVLLMSSREHFLNQNFMRLLSIFPLMLQAKGFDYISIYASICIIVLDQLSYPANHVWKLFLDLMVDLGKLLISRIPDVKTRQFISTFMATISPRLAFSDQLVRNFYFVRKNETVLLFGTSCAEFFHVDSMQDLEAPAGDTLKPFLELSKEDYECLNNACMRANNRSFSDYFHIQVGKQYIEHRIGEGRVMTFFLPETGAYYNFLDYDHLHYGSFRQGHENDVRKALKWLENHGKLPVTCNHKGQLRAVPFNTFVDQVGMRGYGVLSARVKKSGWV
ncbi:hypothetical protein L7F22_062872 [Adiantum nelumboides]|nr:hypothetical protein [Adiantum nelumboides]